MIPVIYIYFTIFVTSISCISLFYLDFYPGELSPFTIDVSGVEIFYWYIINVLALLLVIFVYKYLSGFRFVFGYKIRVKHKETNYLMLALLLINLVFVLETGVGVVGSNATSPLTPLILLLKPDTFFYAYFLIMRSSFCRYKAVVFINVVLFSALKLSQGWSGFIFVLFFLEIYYRYQGRSSLKYMHYIFIAPFIILFLGGALYSKVYVIKNEIRNNPVEEISMYEGVAHLANRLSYLPITIGSVQHHDSIVELYKVDSHIMKEFKSVFRPLLPSLIFKDKDFRTLNNVVMQSYYPNLSKGTSSNFGLPSYLYLLYSISPIEAFLYVFVSIFFVFLVKLFFDFISYFPGQLDFLVLLAMFNLVSIGSLEVVFSYGFFSNLTFLGIAILFGTFKVYKR